MGFLIGLALFIGLVSFVWIADSKAEAKEKAENEVNAKNWLDEELKKPRFKVSVLTKNAKTYESEPFDPYYEIIRFFRWTFCKYSSKELAQTRIERSFKAGRYLYNQTDTYIPMCDIETINVVEA